MKVPGHVEDPASIRTETVQVHSAGGSIPAYLAHASQPGRPGLIVIHEAFGMVEHIHDLARRFAQAGYSSIAPDLYARIGGPDPADMGSVMKTMFALPDAQVVQDLEATAAALRALPGASGKVGCIGFCSGGRQTLLFACSSNKVDAAIDCWGGFIARATPDAESTAQRPTPVLQLAQRLSCPLLGAFGAEDTNPSPVDIDALREQLAKSRQPFEVKLYANAGHAFLADYRPTYREAPAFQLWDDVQAFLSTHLGA